MPGQRAQSHSMTATKLASPHPALAVQSSQTRYLFAATSTNSNSRLFCHKKSPSQITRYLSVDSSDAYPQLACVPPKIYSNNLHFYLGSSNVTLKIVVSADM
jgi:hypothetical protein